MPIDNQLLAFSAVALLLTLAPGPDTFLVIGNTIAGGTRRGIATVLGIVSGGVFHAVIAAFGLARILVHSETAFYTMKTLGALYLLYLGIGALRSAARSNPEPTTVVATPAHSIGRSFLPGVLTNVLNPKVAVFYLAFLPQFIRPDDPIALKSALLVAIHYAMGLVWLGIVALAVGRIAPLLRRDRVRRVLDGVIGTVMTAFGIRLALAAR